MKGLIRQSWFFLKWGVGLTAVSLLLVVPYLYNRVDNEIRRKVEAEFAAKYPNFSVTVRAAQCVEGEGIEIRGLSIRERGGNGPLAEVAYLDEIFLSCPTELNVLLAGQPPVGHVVVRRPVIRATRRMDGSWNAAGLWPIPKFSDRSADSIAIEGGSLELLDARKPSAKPLVFRDINLTVKTADQSPTIKSKAMQIHGTLAGDLVHRLGIEGVFNASDGSWSASGSLEGLALSPELTSALPDEVSRFTGQLGSLRAQAWCQFNLASGTSPSDPIQFRVDGSLVAGRVYDERLPIPLNDLQASVYADNSGVIIRDLIAHSGRSTVQLDCQTWGYSRTSPMALKIKAQKFVVDKVWLDVLPQDSPLRSVWAKFEPAGEINAEVTLAFDGHRWKPDIHVTCLDASFAYNRFPYRAEHATGTLNLKDNLLTLDLQALASGQEINIDGHVNNPGIDFTGWVRVNGANLPIDEKLLTAMPEKQGEIVRSLSASGTFNFGLRLKRDTSQQRVNQELLVELNRCAMRYNKFPYPLRNITGTLRMENGRWTFDDLKGSNGSGTIWCRGSFTPADSGGDLNLNFAAVSVSLEEELRDALPVNSHRIWNDLKPRGTIDLESRVFYRSPGSAPVVTVWASPAAGRAPSDVSIEPVYFPVRLDRIVGSANESREKAWAFFYRDGWVEFKNLRAQHGSVAVSTSGYCQFGADGSWHLHFHDLAADQIRIEHKHNPELIRALPAGLKKVISELQPVGPVNLHGTIDFARGPHPEDLVTADWLLDLQMHQGQLDCGIRLENLFGGVHLKGSYNGKELVCYGDLAVDSVTYRDFQFTNVRGPVYIDDFRVLLGDQPEIQLNSPERRRISANAYGGKIEADCSVTLGSTPAYFLQANLANGDLNRFAGEALSGQQNLRGAVFADVKLTGAGTGVHSLRGEGNIHLREANIYQLPVMYALLKIWSARPPDTNAFTKSDVAFRVEGEHIVFDKIEFIGDAFCLSGNGEMNLATEIQLALHALAPSSQIQLPFVKEMMGQASQNLMLIHVNGTLAEPKATSEAFPELNQALQAFQQGEPVFPNARQALERSGLFPWR